jgi:hypothetical protein
MFKAIVGLTGLVSCVAAAQANAVKTKWLEGQPDYLSGVTFGLPWPRGHYPANSTTFSASGDALLQSWATAYWPDGMHWEESWARKKLTARRLTQMDWTRNCSNGVSS